MHINDACAHVAAQMEKKYHTPYAFAYAPFDDDSINSCKTLYQELKKDALDVIVLVGIGGSHLGSQAIRQLFASHEPLWYELETFAPRLSHRLITQIAAHLAQRKRVLFMIISKSGTTTETLINAALARQLLEEYQYNIRESIVIISDHNSPLAQLAQREGYHLLTIPALLGGRFSIFSAVGYFPLLCSNLVLDAFIEGARAATKASLMSLAHNKAAENAQWFCEQYQTGKHINTLFVSEPDLTGFALWHRQLMAESLGKNKNVGPTPFVAVATTDLHSILQLCLAGPDDKMTRFFEMQSDSLPYAVPDNEFSDLLDFRPHLTLKQIHTSIMSNVKKSFEMKQRVVLHSVFNRHLYDIGFMMQMLMFETVYSALLLDIDPFSQPEVELYKKETRLQLGNV